MNYLIVSAATYGIFVIAWFMNPISGGQISLKTTRPTVVSSQLARRVAHHRLATVIGIAQPDGLVDLHILFVPGEEDLLQIVEKLQPLVLLVMRILSWEKPWEPSPMSLPTLNSTKYVVSIDTIHQKQPG